MLSRKKLLLPIGFGLRQAIDFEFGFRYCLQYRFFLVLGFHLGCAPHLLSSEDASFSFAEHAQACFYRAAGRRKVFFMSSPRFCSSIFSSVVTGEILL